MSDEDFDDFDDPDMRDDDGCDIDRVYDAMVDAAMESLMYELRLIALNARNDDEVRNGLRTCEVLFADSGSKTLYYRNDLPKLWDHIYSTAFGELFQFNNHYPAWLSILEEASKRERLNA
jgi:hypothetical protein